MTYDIYPAVDEDYKFPPVVQQAIADELATTFLPGDATGATNGQVATWDASVSKFIPQPPPSGGNGASMAWVANTAYSAGDKVVSPAGDIVIAFENHDAGDVFKPKLWYSDNYGYLFANFTYNSVEGEKLSLFGSPDGVTVTGHGPNPIFAPATGLRDPSIVKIGNKWFMTYGFHDATQKQFAVASSPDLLNWTVISTLNVSAIPNIAQAWSPELYVNPENNEVFIFFTSVQAVNMEVWYVTPIDGTLTSWTSPTKLNWTTYPSKVMDPVFTKFDNTWYMFYGDNNYICRATATSLLGPWTADNTGNWAGWGANKEGPQIVRIGPTKWRLYIDRYEGVSPNWTYPGYAYTESEDLSNWSALTPLVMGPDNKNNIVLRHGSFIKIPDSSMAATVHGVMDSGASTVRHAEYVTTTVVASSTETQVGTLVLDTVRSFNTGDYSLPAPGQIKIGTTGVYAVSIHAGIGANNFGNADVSQWVTIYSPTMGEVISRDVGNGGYEMSAVSPGVYLNAGDILEFRLVHFNAGSKTINSRIRISKFS
jgi:hypothetical protein